MFPYIYKTVRSKTVVTEVTVIKVRHSFVGVGLSPLPSGQNVNLYACFGVRVGKTFT